MKCTLMHKRIAVAELELDDATGFIQKIKTVYAEEHLPIGVPVKKGKVDRAALNEWWTDRSIPTSRSGIREALETLDIANTKMLLIRCFGLSLSDQYWIRPQNTDISWEKVNFFDNGFSEDIGDVLFGQEKKLDGFDYSSPDITTDGYQKKRWKIIDGKHCLIKGGSASFQTFQSTAIIVSKLLNSPGIDCHLVRPVRFATNIALCIGYRTCSSTGLILCRECTDCRIDTLVHQVANTSKKGT